MFYGEENMGFGIWVTLMKWKVHTGHTYVIQALSSPYPLYSLVRRFENYWYLVIKRQKCKSKWLPGLHFVRSPRKYMFNIRADTHIYHFPKLSRSTQFIVTSTTFMPTCRNRFSSVISSFWTLHLFLLKRREFAELLEKYGSNGSTGSTRNSPIQQGRTFGLFHIHFHFKSRPMLAACVCHVHYVNGWVLIEHLFTLHEHSEHFKALQFLHLSAFYPTFTPWTHQEQLVVQCPLGDLFFSLSYSGCVCLVVSASSVWIRERRA